MTRKIPLLRPFFSEEEIEEIKGVLESGWVSQGPKTREFEGAAAEYLGVPHAMAVSNCTAALHLSLLALGLGPGDEALVSDYTYPATGHSVVYCGAKPVFVDVNERTYNIDTSAIEEKITDKTKGIICVHTFGQTCDMDSILAMAKKHGLWVVEDAACAFGARYNGRQAGTMGDMGCYSFHARKGITTGEGGMVSTAELKLANSVRKRAVFGITGAWEREGQKGFFVPEFTELGYNYKMSDITAALGVVQLRKLDSIIERKRRLAEHWNRELEGMELITPPYSAPDNLHIYQSYVALVRPGLDRNKLIEKLAEKGVQAQIGTYSSHIQPIYGSADKCPVSLDIFNRSIALPMYYGLTEEDITHSAAVLKETLEELN